MTTGPTQLALFPAPPHHHVFKVMQGPHVRLPEDTIKIPANPALWRMHDKFNRYCWGCRTWVTFDHLGNEIVKNV